MSRQLLKQYVVHLRIPIAVTYAICSFDDKSVSHPDKDLNKRTSEIHIAGIDNKYNRLYTYHY